MRRIERAATATATFAVGRVVTLTSSSADRVSASISSAILPISAVVAILGVLLLLMRPVAPSASGAAGHKTKLDTHAALGG
jgi:hypothetical protein